MNNHFNDVFVNLSYFSISLVTGFMKIGIYCISFEYFVSKYIVKCDFPTPPSPDIYNIFLSFELINSINFEEYASNFLFVKFCILLNALFLYWYISNSNSVDCLISKKFNSLISLLVLFNLILLA